MGGRPDLEGQSVGFKRELGQHGYAGKLAKAVFDGLVDPDKVSYEYAGPAVLGQVSDPDVEAFVGLYLLDGVSNSASLMFAERGEKLTARGDIGPWVQLHVHHAAQGMLEVSVSVPKGSLELMTPFGTWAAGAINRTAQILEQHNSELAPFY